MPASTTLPIRFSGAPFGAWLACVAALIALALPGTGHSQPEAAGPAAVPEAVRIPRPNTAIVPDLAAFFRARHEQNLEVARQGDIELLLMGDSITDFWRNEDGPFAGRSVLEEYFGHWKIANFGIAGDTTQGVLYRLDNGEGEGFTPRAVMLMIGTNNTGRNTAAEIAEGIGAVVLSLQQRFGGARILLLGVFPRGAAGNPVRDTIADINRRIARLHDGETVHYLDIGDAFLDEHGNIPTELMSDALHPSTEGYRVWAREVQPLLTQLMEWSTAEDHAHMMRQLGIGELRPGRSSREDAPNAANYDEVLANPYPDWPDLLVMNDGTPVTNADEWWNRRRPEIVESFEREVYGRIPDNVPAVNWTVQATETGTLAGHPVEGWRVIGRASNHAFPLIDVEIEFTLVLPAGTHDPVPVMMMFRGGSLAEAVGNAEPRRFGPPGNDPPATEQLIAAGWGFAFLNPTSVQPDNGAALTRGIIGLTNAGQPRSPDDWGALRAWSWGAARALDYLETVPAVDAQRVGIEGVSRYGKAALVTMAFEPRFAVGFIGSSGAGGVAPYRREFGESVENLTGSGGYHWMAGNFLKYGAEQAEFGRMDANDLPVDSHGLLALSAPRATFVSYGIPEQGDALWLDQQGSYMATVAAGRVYRLLGVGDIGTGDHYQEARLPPVNESLLEGRLAWRQHDGGHTTGPNWRHFIPWAERELRLRED